MQLTLPAGHKLLDFDEIDSTNAEGQRLAAMGEAGPLWIWARCQKQGRGRHGRHWVSPPGNLYATHLFSVSASPSVAAQIGFVAALAIRDLALGIIGNSFAQRLKLKWPNDVLLDDAKFSGILAETASNNEPGRLTLVLGCGINLASAPTGTPYPVTSLAAHGGKASPASALESLAQAIEHWKNIWQIGNGFDRIRTAWLSHAKGLGDRMVGDNGLEGVFAGLAENGAMIIRLRSGENRIVHSGEVRFASTVDSIA